MLTLVGDMSYSAGTKGSRGGDAQTERNIRRLAQDGGLQLSRMPKQSQYSDNEGRRLYSAVPNTVDEFYCWVPQTAHYDKPSLPVANGSPLPVSAFSNVYTATGVMMPSYMIVLHVLQENTRRTCMKFKGRVIKG